MATSYQRNAYDCCQKLFLLLVNAWTARKVVGVRNVTLNTPYIANRKVLIHAKTKGIMYFLSLLFVFIIVLILEIFTYYFTHQ